MDFGLDGSIIASFFFEGIRSDRVLGALCGVLCFVFGMVRVCIR